MQELLQCFNTTESESAHLPDSNGKANVEEQKPFRKIYEGDASRLSFILENSVDLVVTSPPYWRKRDYGVKGQIGQEKTSEEYVAAIITAMAEWKRVLRPTGSVFMNIGDTYWQKSLQGIPSMIETRARAAGWLIRNRIIWVKKAECLILLKID